MNLKSALGHSIFETISESSEELGVKSFVIGGYVRDFILKRENKTLKDIDIVCDGSGIELAQHIADKLLSKPKVQVFKRFGTAMIKLKEFELEFVGARKESYRSDSRNPIVENGSIEDDQNRRDFTINTLAISLNRQDYGQLIDPFDGVSDLNKKILKTPLNPDVTYSDDPLRMMRAIRFASQLGFEIEKESLQSIKKNAQRIEIVSIERTMVEFNKIMMSHKPSVGLYLLDKCDLLKYILPELISLKGVDEIKGQKHKDNFIHTLEVVDNICENTDNIWLRWAALLHDIGKSVTKRFDDKIGWTFHSHEFVGSKRIPTIFKRLKLPLNDNMQYVKKIIMMHSRPIAVVDDSTGDSAVRRLVFDAGDDISDLLTLCKADITTKNKILYRKYKNNFAIVENKIASLEEADKLRNWKSPITGIEIMKLLDIKPGRQIGVVKSKVKEAILNGDIKNDLDSAREFVLKTEV